MSTSRRKTIQIFYWFLDIEKDQIGGQDTVGSIKLSRRQKANNERAKLNNARNDGREESQAEAIPLCTPAMHDSITDEGTSRKAVVYN